MISTFHPDRLDSITVSLFGDETRNTSNHQRVISDGMVQITKLILMPCLRQIAVKIILL